MMYNEDDELKEKIRFEDEYMTERLEEQIYWYEKKSNAAKSMDRWTKFLSILFAVLIPMVVAIGQNTMISNMLIVVFSTSVVLLIVFQQIFGFQTTWKEYLLTSKRLKHEKMLYLTRPDYYSKEEAFQDLVHKVEAVISDESPVKIKQDSSENIRLDVMRILEKTSNKKSQGDA